MSRKLVIAAAMAAALLNTGALAQSAGTTGGASTGGTSTPGTNSAGTAQSSGMTTGTGRGALGTGRADVGPDSDIGVNTDNRSVDRKIKSICKGC